MASVGEDMEKIVYPLLVGILNGSLASKNSMRAPQKVKHDVITLVPGLGRSPGEGKGYPLQYSGLENSMDCIVHGAAKSWTWLSDIHLSYDPGISSWVYTKKMKNIPFTQNLYMNVHNNIVHNSQRVKITQTSIKWEKDNQNVVHPYNRKLFNNKKNEVLIHAATLVNLENIIINERNQARKATYCVIPFVWNTHRRTIQKRS